MTDSPASEHTPYPVVANISRVVTKVIDRITGDRADYPLLVAAACVEALKNFGIEASVMYGQVAWLEVMPDHSILWAGCWGENIHFWVETKYNEIIDLNTSVAHRTRAHGTPELKALFSPPMLWTIEVPKFYIFKAEGIAELELTEGKDVARFEAVLREVREKCTPKAVSESEQDFPNEPILCVGRKLLDDSQESFKQFDRALSVRGMPPAPF
jgi:hypothetical protein